MKSRLAEYRYHAKTLWRVSSVVGGQVGCMQVKLDDAGGGRPLWLELPRPSDMGRLRHAPLRLHEINRFSMTSPQHDPASPPRSPVIPDAVLRIYEEQHITKPLLAALTKLQDQLQAAGTTEAPPKRAPYAKTPELAWGRLSPQLTPTPSPSPSPKHTYCSLPSPKPSHRSPPGFLTPPDTSPQREDSASASPTKPSAATRQSRRKQASQVPMQPSHTMLRRSEARGNRTIERRTGPSEQDAKRIVGG